VAIGAAGALYAISYQGIMTVTKKVAAIMAPPEQRGAAISTNMLVIDIAGIMGSLIPGLLNTHFGYTTTFYCMLVYPVIGILIYLAIAKKLDALESR
jgi:predicted MFS family arabinose efflux permease